MTKQIVMILGIGFLIFVFLTATQFRPLWSLMSARAPRPEITQGEFAFRLEYEIDGERIVIEDTVIVEHGGTSWDAGIGNHNVWNNRLASGDSEIIEIYRSDTEVIFIPILGVLSGWYLLSMDSIREEFHVDFPTIRRLNINDEGVSSQHQKEVATFFSENTQPNWHFFFGARRYITNEDLFLLDEYGIQLISFEYDPPIVNSFR
jgi:hypothetical protein